ncbi:MAG TPA: hypothetical protein PKG48_04520 [Bacteroidales bacterium]|nr:hypothetical protein [Bacteroidales bacterium]
MAKTTGKINEIFDQQAITKQIEGVKGGLESTLKLLEQVAVAGKNVSVGMGKAKDINEQTAAQKALNKAEAEGKRLAEELKTVENEQAVANERNRQALAAKKRELRENVQLEKAAKDSISATTKLVRDLTSAYNQMSSAERKSAAGQELKKHIADTNKLLRDQKMELNDTSKNVGNYGSVWDRAKGIMMKATGVIAAMYGAMRVAKSVIQSTQGTADAFERTMGGVNSGLGFVAKSLANMDFSNFWKGLGEAVRRGREYADTLDDIADKQRALAMTEADDRVILASKLKELRNVNKSEAERVAIAKEILAIEDKNSKARISNAKETLDAELKKNVVFAKLSQQEILDGLKKYQVNDKLNKQADEYLKAESDRATAKRLSVAASSVEEKIFYEQQLARAEKKVKSADAETKAYARIYAGINNLSDAERDAIKTASVAYSESLASFDEATMRTETRMNSLLAKEEGQAKKTEKTIETSGKKQEKSLAATFAMRVEMGKASINEMWNAEKAAIQDQEAYKLLSEDEKNEYLLMKWREFLSKQFTITKEQADNINAMMRSAADSGFKGTTPGVIPKAPGVKTDPNAGINEEGGEAPAFSFGTQKQIDETSWEIQTKKAADWANRQVELYGETYGRMTEIVDGFFANELARIDQKSAKDEAARERELEAAGGNSAKIDAINAKYDKKKKERDKEALKLKQKQAKYDMAVGIMNAIINTAVGVTNMLTVQPAILGVVLAALAAATGLAEIAVLASTPIPQYAKGRKGGKAEYAVVGEKGAEAVVTKDGNAYLTPDQPTFTYLPEGATVIPNHELYDAAGVAALTTRLPAYESSYSISLEELRGDVRGLYAGFIMLAGVVRDKRENHLNITAAGMSKLSRHGADWERYLNDEIRF